MSLFKNTLANSASQAVLIISFRLFSIEKILVNQGTRKQRMNDTPKKKQESTNAAAWLLYAASALGILSLITAAHVKGQYSHLLLIDITAYIILIVTACFIHRGVGFAKVLYAILAVIWYVTLMLVLAPKLNHPLDWYVVFMQLTITLLAYVILYSPQRSHHE